MTIFRPLPNMRLRRTPISLSSRVASIALRRVSPLVFFCWALSPLQHGLAQSGGPGLDNHKRDDVVQARQFLMDAIDEQVGPIDLATTGKFSDLNALKSRAYLINTLLGAFPHLFPPETRPIDIPENGIQTAATAEVWGRFEAFYALSQQAAQAAYEASQSENEASFRTHAIALRMACNACHAEFMATQSSSDVKQK